MPSKKIKERKMKVKRFGIRTKLNIGFGLIITILGLLTIISYTSVKQLASANERNTHTYKVIGKLDAILLGMINMETGQRGFAITGDEVFLEPFQLGQKQVNRSYKEVKALTDDNQRQQELLVEIKKDIDVWIDIANNRIELRKQVNKGNQDMAVIIKEERTAKGKSSMDNLRRLLTKSRKIETDLLTERENRSDLLLAIALKVVLFGIGLAIVLAVLISFFLSSQIIKPIKILLSSLQEASRGNLNATVHIKAKDEFGVLADSFNKMLDNIRILIADVGKRSEEVASASEEMTAALSESANMSQNIYNNILEVSKSIKDQNQMTSIGNEQIQGLLKQIDKIADLSTESSTLTSEAMKMVDSGTKSIKDQQQMMEENKNSFKKVDTEIKNLLDKSKEIGNIITLIGKIAKQTNLLALNAAIEAERSGEHGRGFNVVAEEVRDLAEESSKSTQQINFLISEIQENITSVSEQVNITGTILEKQVVSIDKTSETFGTIYSSVENLTQNIDQVSKSSDILNKDSEEVGEKIATISQLANQTETTTEKTTKIIEEQRNTTAEINTAANQLQNISSGLLNSASKFIT